MAFLLFDRKKSCWTIKITAWIVSIVGSSNSSERAFRASAINFSPAWYAVPQTMLGCLEYRAVKPHKANNKVLLTFPCLIRGIKVGL